MRNLTQPAASRRHSVGAARQCQFNVTPVGHRLQADVLLTSTGPYFILLQSRTQQLRRLAGRARLTLFRPQGG